MIERLRNTRKRIHRGAMAVVAIRRIPKCEAVERGSRCAERMTDRRPDAFGVYRMVCRDHLHRDVCFIAMPGTHKPARDWDYVFHGKSRIVGPTPPRRRAALA